MSEQAKLFRAQLVGLAARQHGVGFVISHLEDVGLQLVQVEVVAENVAKGPTTDRRRVGVAEPDVGVDVGVAEKVSAEKMRASLEAI